MGEIIARFEKKGMVCKGLKTFQTPKSVAEEHYKDLSDKPFFGDLVDYICSGPVVCMVWEGPGVVKSARLMIGATNPLAEREIGLWFGGDDELLDYEVTMTPWVRE
jgi:nucleoside-diphosphate kinase